jgi:hypothetical protein
VERWQASLLGPDVAKPARRFEQPVVIGPAARAALKVDRGARVNAGWILPGELQLNVGVEDVGTSSAARISILGPQELIQIATIGHRLRLSWAIGVSLLPSS